MTLVAAAVCPHPPLLVPEVGRGVDLAARGAAREAVTRLVAAEPDLIVLVGADAALQRYDASDAGSLARYGVDLTVPLGAVAEPGRETGPARLPLSLTVGAWLLAAAGWTGERRAYGVPDTMRQPEATALGGEVAGLAGRVALLCMGDGSARRTEKAPGWLDERAEPFDHEVTAALRAADPQRLAALDGGLAHDLLVAGWASWQVLAAAAGDATWSGDLLADEAPYGVGYFVASWSRTDDAPGAAG